MGCGAWFSNKYKQYKDYVNNFSKKETTVKVMGGITGGYYGSILGKLILSIIWPLADHEKEPPSYAQDIAGILGLLIGYGVGSTSAVAGIFVFNAVSSAVKNAVNGGNSEQTPLIKGSYRDIMDQTSNNVPIDQIMKELGEIKGKIDTLTKNTEHANQNASISRNQIQRFLIDRFPGKDLFKFSEEDNGKLESEEQGIESGNGTKNNFDLNRKTL